MNASTSWENLPPDVDDESALPSAEQRELPLAQRIPLFLAACMMFRPLTEDDIFHLACEWTTDDIDSLDDSEPDPPDFKALLNASFERFGI